MESENRALVGITEMQEGTQEGDVHRNAETGGNKK